MYTREYSLVNIKITREDARTMSIYFFTFHFLPFRPFVAPVYLYSLLLIRTFARALVTHHSSTARCHFLLPHICFVSFSFFFDLVLFFHLQWILFSTRYESVWERRKEKEKERGQKTFGVNIFIVIAKYCFSCGCHFVCVCCCAVKLKQNSNILVLRKGKPWDERERESNKLNWWVSFVSVAFLLSFCSALLCFCFCFFHLCVRVHAAVCRRSTIANNNLEPRVSRKLLLSFQRESHLLIRESKREREAEKRSATKHVQSTQSYRQRSVLLHICSFSFFFLSLSLPSIPPVAEPVVYFICVPFAFHIILFSRCRSFAYLPYLYAFGSLSHSLHEIHSHLNNNDVVCPVSFYGCALFIIQYIFLAPASDRENAAPEKANAEHNKRNIL